MKYFFVLLIIVCIILPGCEKQEKTKITKLKVGMILDTGGDSDKGFNEYSLQGAKNAAEKAGIEFEYLISESTSIFERNIEKVIKEGADLVFTVGFALANATAKAALRYPDRHFVIMDSAYFPGNGCSESVNDCYTEEGGLTNVTSLLFAEDQPAYLAGVLAACMSKTDIIGSVAGYEIPPVVRFVEGFINGARSVKPGITTYKRYIPDFNDPDTGKVVATDFISKGADVLFCPGGKTGLGGLMAATEARIMAIGVDVDQYRTFPDARSSLITSVMKNVDVAAAFAIKSFTQKNLQPGIIYFSLDKDAVGLAPYHDWQDRISAECTDLVEKARQRILDTPDITGVRLN
ncbi:BMP family ABC transporter substrate-binding protein [Desulfopila sp. IMCC35008]|uniref:BMP family ABC transporter substrate-binding protein n=1 Tax=Desulfopila sp. IMCC35008 TaxID=2653858 RepID=UPI0013D8A536|nr:BMP family ABC transporter substrate-binding protein [Desulfopila sp. IMCC35008]